MNTSALPRCLGTFTPFDSSAEKDEWVLDCPSGHQIRVSAVVYTILSGHWDGKNFAELAEVLKNSGLADATSQDVQDCYDRAVEKIDKITSTRRLIDKNFRLRFTILNERIVSAIARAAAPVYAAAAAAPLVCFASITLGIWFGSRWSVHQNAWSFQDVSIAYGMYLVTLLLHEFGHAAATSRYGEKPGPIGFTLYLVFPALYSEVTPAWRLKRWQRVVVDLGGEYFQLTSATCIMWADVLTHWVPFHIAVLMIIGTSIFNLNPLFKFDGYWVLADALGVPNLSQRAMDMIKRLFVRRTNDTGLPGWVVGGLAIYAFASTSMWAYFIIAIAENLASMTAFLLSTMRHVLQHQTPLTAGLIGNVFGALLGLLVSVYVTVNLFQQWLPALARIMQRLVATAKQSAVARPR